MSGNLSAAEVAAQNIEGSVIPLISMFICGTISAFIGKLIDDELIYRFTLFGAGFGFILGLLIKSMLL